MGDTVAIKRTRTFAFRGKKFEVDVAAAHSARVYKAINLIDTPGHQAAGWEAYDKLFCGHTDEYMDTVPPKDGEDAPYGATLDDFRELVAAAVEAANAKN